MNAETDPRQLSSDEPSGPSVGALLRTAREARALDIGDVAFALKLNPRQVEALESDRFDLLPGRAFARGFLKNYARFLALDPTPLLATLDAADGEGAMELSPISNARGTMPSADERMRPSVMPAALVALALLVVVLAGWYFDWFQQPPVIAEESVSPAPYTAAPPPAIVLAPPGPAPEVPDQPVPVSPPAPVAAVEPASPAPVAPTPAPAPAEDATPRPAAAEGLKSLVFRFTEDAWVEVRDGSGRIIMSRIGKAGAADEVQGKPPFALVIGNASNVSLVHDGREVDLAPHIRVTVARLKLE